MDQFDDNEITKLLRLKRYEQPPPAYFDNFLHEFHRRQRDELLRQPLWRICLERAHDFMFKLNVPSLTSYPAAVTAVLIFAAVLSLKIYQAPETNRFAQTPTAIATPVNAEGEWTLDSSAATRVLSTKPLRNSRESALTHRASAQPRYVLDSVPVSYEPTFRF
jgi:energy-converting hydrogenase Eha subunit A